MCNCVPMPSLHRVKDHRSAATNISERPTHDVKVTKVNRMELLDVCYALLAECSLRQCLSGISLGIYRRSATA